MTTATLIELSWTALAILGVVLSAYVWLMTYRERRLYLRTQKEPDKIEIALRELRTSAVFLLITTMYAIAGLAAMVAPSSTPQAESTNLARWMVIGALMTTVAAIVIVKILNIWSRRKVERMFERRRGE